MKTYEPFEIAQKRKSKLGYFTPTAKQVKLTRSIETNNEKNLMLENIMVMADNGQ